MSYLFVLRYACSMYHRTIAAQVTVLHGFSVLNTTNPVTETFSGGTTSKHNDLIRNPFFGSHSPSEQQARVRPRAPATVSSVSSPRTGKHVAMCDAEPAGGADAPCSARSMASVLLTAVLTSEYEFLAHTFSLLPPPLMIP